MADIHVADDMLIIDLTAAERLGSLHLSTVKIPISTITGITAVPSAAEQVRGFRAPGLGLPGRAAVGTWRGRGFKDFVVVYGRGPGVVVTTRDFPYDRVLLSTGDGDALVARLAQPA